MNRFNSPYSAALTGCAFMYNEYMRILPLLMAKNSDELMKEEIENNQLFLVNSRKARMTFRNEFIRRYKAVSASFWESFLTMREEAQRAGLLYAILKTYKLVFDFHFNVTIKRWNSVEQSITKNDLMMEFCEISSRDEFVDSWTENTKSRCASHYLTCLRQAGMLGANDSLQQICLEASEFEYYIRHGEEWFLEACLLYPYEINDIKAKLNEEYDHTRTL